MDAYDPRRTSNRVRTALPPSRLLRRSGLLAPKPTASGAIKGKLRRYRRQPIASDFADADHPPQGYCRSAANVSVLRDGGDPWQILPAGILSPWPKRGHRLVAVARFPPAVIPSDGSHLDDRLINQYRPASGTSAATNAPPFRLDSCRQAPARCDAQCLQAGQPQRPAIDLPPIEGTPGVQVPNLSPNPEPAPQHRTPARCGWIDFRSALPRPDHRGTAKLARRAQEFRSGPCPISPGTQRDDLIISPSGRPLQIVQLPATPDGMVTYICRGGINLVTEVAKFGIIDIEADQAVIWRGPEPREGRTCHRPQWRNIDDAVKQPMEVYLEGNVMLRQDESKFAGKGDQRTLRAPRVYYDFLSDRFLAHTPRSTYSHRVLLAPSNSSRPGSSSFTALSSSRTGRSPDPTSPRSAPTTPRTTGSRFPKPGYKITNSSIDLTRHSRPLTEPDHGQGSSTNPKRSRNRRRKSSGRSTLARTSITWGPSRSSTGRSVVTDIDDMEPPLRMFCFRNNNYFGQMFLTDCNGVPAHSDVQEAQVDRPLECRHRLPECPDQGLPGARERDRLVRHATSYAT